MRRKSHVRCEAGENLEITSKDYLSLLYVYTKDREYIEKKRIARNLGADRTDYINIKFPYYFQSTTVKRTMFDKVKELVKNSLGIDLYCRVVYD